MDEFESIARAVPADYGREFTQIVQESRIKSCHHNFYQRNVLLKAVILCAAHL